MTIGRILLAVVTFVLIIFIFKHCSGPTDEQEAEQEQAFRMQEAISKAEKVESQARQDSIGKFYIDSLSKIKVVLKSQERENKVLTSQLVKLRTPRVDTLILDNPDLASYVETLKEIVEEQAEEIDTLKSALEFSEKVFQELTLLEGVEDRVESDLALQNSIRIADLEKQSRKKERKSRLARALIPVVGVLGILLGAQL